VNCLVPADWADRADLSESLGLAFEDLIDPMDLPIATAAFAAEFYRECHFKAIKATVATIITNTVTNSHHQNRIASWIP
jgi:hypothetical protein